MLREIKLYDSFIAELHGITPKHLENLLKLNRVSTLYKLLSPHPIKSIFQIN